MQCMMEVSEKYAERLAAAFVEQGEGYYASPCGRQWGHVEAPGFFCMVMGETGSEDGGRRGVHRAEEGGATITAWVRSSGVWVAVIQQGDGAKVACAGPRHSVREVLAWGIDVPTMWEALERLPAEVYGWGYIESQRRDLAPWETET